MENTFSSLLDVDGTEKYSQANIELILINFLQIFVFQGHSRYATLGGINL